MKPAIAKHTRLSQHRLAPPWLLLSCLLFGQLLVAAPTRAAEALSRHSIEQFSTQVCKTPEALESAGEMLFATAVSMDSSTIEFRRVNVGERVTMQTTDREVIEIQLLTPPARGRQTIVTSYSDSAQHSLDRPQLQLSYDDQCQLLRAQSISYDTHGTALYIESLNPALQAIGERQWLNPPLPVSAETLPDDKTRVAMIDSGVNYQLPLIAAALARDDHGNTIGYDFWDMDNKPFDANPARSPFFVQRHGTRTASILLREAPDISLVPYRYPRPDMSRMADLLAHAAAHDVRIIGMPLGSNTYKDWVVFAREAEQHPDMLFIVSAGNNGRDIDNSPVYPASMEMTNMIVVTSADDFVRPAERTNYGRLSVDYLLPAENIRAVDFDGSDTRVSGSSYAVSRMAALAARLLDSNKAMTTDQLKRAIKNYSVRANTSRYVTQGYLGNPLADRLTLEVETIPVTGKDPESTVSASYRFPLVLVTLDETWDEADIATALDELNTILSQCSIDAQIEKRLTVTAPGYLQDLSTGNALSLQRRLKLSGTRVFFARDTQMQPAFDAEAFGEGNTRNRPWMTNSLWLTNGITDAGIALAHELFHILTNNGNHTQEPGNLLRDITSPANTRLTPAQCGQAQQTGVEFGLLFEQ